MKTIMLFVALLVMPLGPAFAGPGGCTHSRDQTAEISCAEGTVWDQKSASCITLDS